MFRKDQLGIYIHWPFCAAKCPYCDFNSHVREGIDEERWEQAYLTALKTYADMLPDHQVVSVFFGGGTPSLMRPQTVAAILETIQKHWRIANDLEVTLEANPTSVEAEKFKAFAQGGVNRISLGVQAMNEADLKFLGRQHNVNEALQAIDIAGKIFDRYSFDLMYARPDQTLKQWEQELKNALQYGRGHLSLYQLTIERNTPFYMQYHRREFSIPGENEAADFYNLTQDILEAENLPAYEVSNHASAGNECRHNLMYWHYADYIGIGPGAHGRFFMNGEKHAVRDHSAPEIWVERVQKEGHGAHPHDIIPPDDRLAEMLMMGLRLREGLSYDRVAQISGKNLLQSLNQKHLNAAKEAGWIIQSNNTLQATREGWLRLNALIPYLLN
jgi:putative oxygen-independent coproporphyrinogen III oxidase